MVANLLKMTGDYKSSVVLLISRFFTAIDPAVSSNLHRATVEGGSVGKMNGVC